MEKYIYLKDTNKIQDTITNELYDVGKYYNFDGVNMYFRINITKHGEYRILKYKYAKSKYKDKSIINKTALIERIRKCNIEQLKQVFKFFNDIGI